MGSLLQSARKGSPVPRERPAPLRVVLVTQLERLLVERRGGCERVQAIGAVACFPQGHAGAVRDRLDILLRGPRKLERPHVVVGEHLGAVLPIGAKSLDPFGGPEVLFSPQRPRHLAVRDVADEHMTERVLRLRGDRREPLAPDEFLALEPVQLLLDRPTLLVRHGGQRAAPEHLPEHGRILDERLVLRREGVEPRRDDALNVFGQGNLLDRLEAPLGDHPRVLLRIQRVSTCAREQWSLQLRRHHRLVEEAAEEPRNVRFREWRDRDGRRIRLAASPVRPPLEQLRPRRRNDEERRLGRPVDEVVDEVEQVVVGPVQVLEDEHERTALGERLEEAPPRRKGLGAAIHAAFALLGEADERPQLILYPPCGRGVRDQIGDRFAELGLGDLGRVRLEDGSLGLDHLRECPERDALAVGKRAPLTPLDEVLGIVVHDLPELPDQPALADAGDADERQKLRRPLRPGAGKCIREQIDLRLAPDERRTARCWTSIP
jgi:hypothetical protein